MRGHGEGSIIQRKDGTWQGAVSLGNGKRRYFYGKTRPEVRDQVITALADQKENRLVAGSRRTVEQFLDTWLEEVARQKVRPTTFVRYESVVRLHLVPQLGARKLTKLGPEEINRAYQELGKKFSPATVGHAHRLLHQALDVAVRWRYIGRNPCELVDPPKIARKEIQALTAEQARAFVRAAQGDPLEALYVVAVTTGMRQGELLGLKWGDIDFEAAKLYVRRSIGRVAGKGWIEQEPKTASGRRCLTLSPLAARSLRQHHARQVELRLAAGPEWEARDLVFCNAVGRPIEEPNLRLRSFKPLLKRAGLPDIRFHDLRHSAATLLFALNTHPKTVQAQLGHSNISVTLDIYSHALPELQAEAAVKLDALLAAN